MPPFSAPLGARWSGYLVHAQDDIGFTRLRVLSVAADGVPLDARSATSDWPGVLEILFEQLSGLTYSAGAFDDLSRVFVAKRVLDGSWFDAHFTVSVLDQARNVTSARCLASATTTLEVLPDVIHVEDSRGLNRTLAVGESEFPGPERVFTRNADPESLTMAELLSRGVVINGSRETDPSSDLIAARRGRTFGVAIGNQWIEPRDERASACFHVPYRSRMDRRSGGWFPVLIDAPDVVHARRPGDATLTRTVDPHVDGIDPVTDLLSYAVTPTRLSLELSPAPQDDRDGRLLFEDRWLERPSQPNGGRLVASFRFKVFRSGDLLYDSSSASIFTWQLTGAGVEISSITTFDADGVPRTMPFRIRLRTTRTSVVTFWLDDGEPAAGTVMRPCGLDDIVAAVGYGMPCEISVELLDLEEPVPLNLDVYEMPAAKTLAVEIPPPLEAELESYSDAWFTGDDFIDWTPSGVTSAGTDPTEVIYSSGMLRARIRNRTGADSENIELTKEATPGRLPLSFDGQPDDLEHAVGDVFGLIEGSNTLRLTAVKPINRATGSGPSVDRRSLLGVRPRNVELTSDRGFMSGRQVIRRNVGGFHWSYERAATLELRSLVQPTLSASTPPAAELTSAVSEYVDAIGSGAVTLQPIVGHHVLQLRVANDFGEVVTELRFEAMRPALDFELLTDDLPHDGLDLARVGHSVQKLPLRLTARFCTEVGVRVALPSGGATALRTLSPPESAMAGWTTELDAPESGALGVGDNVLQLTWKNEFDVSEHVERIVNRRAHVYDTRGTFQMRPCDTKQIASVNLVSIDPSGWHGFVPRVYPRIDETIDDRGQPSPYGFASLRYGIVDPDPSDDDLPETYDVRVVFEVESIGPDYEHAATFMKIDPHRVDATDPDSVQFPLEALSDITGIDTDHPERYWRRARVVDGDELFILLLTRSLSEQP